MMRNKKTDTEAKKNRKHFLQKGSQVADATSSAVLSQILADTFGGRKVSKKGRNSIQAIQKQVDELEKLLKQKE
jgi:hypothetical protein